MSSTNRGAKRKPADYYPTPGWCTRRFLEAVDLPSGRWLEPAAGSADIIREVNAFYNRGWVEWTALELREECRRELESIASRTICPCDFVRQARPNRQFELALDGSLEVVELEHHDVILTNPPFSLAMEFIENALPLADIVVMFLRLNFLGSATRNAFLRRHMPDVYVVPNRPSFTPDGQTDSIEYGWFVWPEPARRRRTRGEIVVLPDTPIEERRRSGSA